MRGTILAAGLAVACVAGIAVVQPALSARTAKIKLGADVTALPPAEQLKAMTVGYHAAGSDILWAMLLLEYGTHWEQHRALEGLPRYIDGILALDKDHPMVYEFVDTLLVLAKTDNKATQDDVRIVRAYFERGTRERPFDAKIWLQYGQFLAFLAPSFLTDADEKERYRHDGALAIIHAVDLGADADRSLAASSILSKTGETKAVIQQLQRAYALTDNPETRQQISLKLQRLEASTEAEDAVAKVDYDWRSHYPFLSRNAVLLIGPTRETPRCAGPASARDARCASDWSAATAPMTRAVGVTPP